MSQTQIVSDQDQAILSAKRYIVIHALEAGVDGKLLTNTQLNEQYGIVAGTIQRALTSLKNSGALITRSKGHMGRVITQMDTGLCWSMAKLKPVQLLMPSSGSIEIDILIKNITSKLSQLNIPYFISNEPGGENRIEKVIAGDYDIALVSQGAAENMQNSLTEEQVKTLEPNTYYSLNRLVIVSRDSDSTEQWKNIAIDRNSSDHTRITEAEFPQTNGFEYTETDFRQIPARVLRKEVDAGLWHITSSPVPLSFSGLKASKFTNESAISIHQSLSAATFVINPNRPELTSLLAELENQEIVEQQKKAFAEEDPYTKAFD
ncbi:YhfZ family protein [Vibrio sp. HN007]|uniref:YhfZ family protein n=1 Tax=Vibrio iocasae TaxID=3098914 RepID=UPI0035D4D68C